MRRKLTAINFLLILVLFMLLGWGTYSWYYPKLPATINEDEIVQTPRELQVPTLSRKVYSNSMVGDVARLNLFRKQRKKYYRPKPPKPKPKPKVKSAPPKVAVIPPPPPPKPTAPPPKLILTGVMLLNNQKMAIFEGTYSEIRGGKLVQNLKPHRRGYKIGETLGGYRIESINKTRATLSAISGGNLTLTISKTPPTQKIQKTRNRLIQKSNSVSRNNPGTLSSSRTRRSQRIPFQKKHLNRILPKTGSPGANLPPALSAPSTKSSGPPNPNRLPIRQKPMGF
jgi:hypothetical protein